uniref:TRAP transporter small permease n=1 Tax=Ningiella ruwaisensis TaxID=2364274 RepID=UPI0010A02F47|nr:TRAP transporter small permease [Ningiella ruwaisensis]
MNKLAGLIQKGLEAVLVILLAALVMLVLWQVASRFLLSSPSSFTDELSRYLMIWVALLGAAWVTAIKAHLAIDLLSERLKPAYAIRLQVLLQLLILGFALGVLVYGGSNLVHLTLRLEQVSAALELPLGYVYLVLPASGLLISFFSIHHILIMLKEGK